MTTDLATLTEALKRGVAVPGEFETVFPNTSDDNLIATLGDAFAECQMDGFFSTMALDTDTYQVTPDMSAAGGALVVIYAEMRILRTYIRELGTRSLYEAGPVKYETERAASVLKEELTYLKERKNELIQQGKAVGRATHVIDGYFARAATDWTSYGGFYSYEMG